MSTHVRELGQVDTVSHARARYEVWLEFKCFMGFGKQARKTWIKAP
jgi:hypothetical protein